MPNITINNHSIQVSDGSTILTAASLLGIEIPTMCWLKEFKLSTSCMVCMVEDKKSGKMLPACSSLAQEGMDIITENESIQNLRKSAVELLLSDHLGDCEAPCQRVCPANMDIPLMNRLIAEDKFEEAVQIVKQTIPIPGVLGYICPAPCEKACRRKDVDAPLAICMLKRIVGEETFAKSDSFLPKVPSKLNKKVAIIGIGPTGLSAAYYLLSNGFDCTLFDKNTFAGGLMRSQIPDEKLPKIILDKEIKTIENLGGKFIFNQLIDTNFIKNSILNHFDAILFSIGIEKINLDAKQLHKGKFGTLDFVISEFESIPVFWETNREKQIYMAVRSVKHGKLWSEIIHSWLIEHKVTLLSKLFNSSFDKLTILERKEYLKESQNSESRVPVASFLQGLSHEEAIAEASRCLHCDCRKPDTCKLRILATQFQANQKTYRLPERKYITKAFQHDLVIFEPQKCIKCGICIQISTKNKDEAGFTFIGRGFDVEIGFPLNQTIEKALKNTALACAENCPTGAIAVK